MIVVVEEHALGHLELQALGIGAGISHDAHQGVEKPFCAELHRRQVDRNEEVGPAERDDAGLA